MKSNWTDVRLAMLYGRECVYIYIKRITEEFDRLHPILIERRLASHGGESDGLL